MGEKQVGIAVSDDGGSIAFPIGTVDRSVCVEHILSLIAERGIDVVVIGESVDLDGNDNSVMGDVREMLKHLKIQ